MLPATLTTSEAAAALECSESYVRDLVARGKLAPVRHGAKPLRFGWRDVYDLQVARRDAAWKAWHGAIWAEYDRLLAG